MRRAPNRRPAYATLAQAQSGRHYASHVDQPRGAQYDLVLVDRETMDRQLHACDPATARGIPTTYDYVEGVIRVWPWPAEGWQVWSGVSGKDVTP
jgi:hypothetical protein